MGYVTRSNPSMIEVKTNVTTAILCDTTLRDTDLAPITIPSYTKPLMAAYIDLIINTVRNAAGVTNHFESGQLQIDYSGWHDAMLIPATCNWVSASENGQGSFILPGATDIKAYIAKGTVQAIRLAQHSAHADSMYLYGVSIAIRLYFE